MRILTRGLGGAAHHGMITTGLGPLIVEVVRIIRGGRTVARDIYGDKLEEFKIAAMLVAINGKELLSPIFNKRNYTINEEVDVDVKAQSGTIKRRKRNIFGVIVDSLKVKRGKDGDN